MDKGNECAYGKQACKLRYITSYVGSADLLVEHDEKKHLTKMHKRN